jgi:hypothetical protein
MRTIDPSILMDDWFGSLSYDRQVFWIGLILIADDQGRTLASPAALRAQIFPYSEDITVAQIATMLDEFESRHRILRYTAGINGSRNALIQILNWWKYQRNASWMAASKYAAPDGWTDRCRYHAKGNEIVTRNWDQSGGFPSPLPSPLPSREDEDEDEDEDDGEAKVDTAAVNVIAGQNPPHPAGPAPELATAEKILFASTLGQKKGEAILSVLATRKTQQNTIRDVMATLAYCYNNPKVKSPLGLAATMLLAEEIKPDCMDPLSWKVLPPAVLQAAGVNSDELGKERMSEEIRRTKERLDALDVKGKKTPPPPEVRAAIDKLTKAKRIRQ